MKTEYKSKQAGRGLLFLTLLLLSSLTGCSTSADDGVPGDEVAVNFFSEGIGSEFRTRAAIPLGRDVTLRVVAYRHRSDGTLAAENYVKENTYTVQSDGTLKANDSDLYLPAGTYDFYAVTPALEVDHSGAAPKVSVDHLTDYAVSQTSGTPITTVAGGTSHRVQLASLERKCAQMLFQLDVDGAVVNNEALTKVLITEATVTGLSDGPLAGIGTQNLAQAATMTKKLTMDGSRFATDSKRPTLSTGGGAVLPKPAGGCSLLLGAVYNDVNTIQFESASLTKIEFLKGYRYAFVAIWKNDMIFLRLVVAPWTVAGVNADMGSSETLVYPVGQWTLSKVDSNLGEGGLTVWVAGWQSSDWSGNLGEGGLSVGSIPGWTKTDSVDYLLGEGGLTLNGNSLWTPTGQVNDSWGEGGITTNGSSWGSTNVYPVMGF